MDSLLTWDTASRFLSIVVIDLVVSGDNAIAIGMAAASLPPGQRRLAILLGGGAAVVLRIALTSGATLLLRIMLLSAVGGCVLFWIAYRLLQLDVGSRGGQAKAKEGRTFRQAIVLILAADFLMSLDNVIAVAGAAHGSIELLIAGLLLSMPLLMATGGAISLLFDRFKWLIFVGGAAISFTGMRMILEDRLIEEHTGLRGYAVMAISVAVGLALPAVFAYINRKRRVAKNARKEVQ